VLREQRGQALDELGAMREHDRPHAMMLCRPFEGLSNARGSARLRIHGPTRFSTAAAIGYTNS
jgi:hypothetical protein